MGNLFIEFPKPPPKTPKQKRREFIVETLVVVAILTVAVISCAVLDPIVRPPHECPCECPVVP